MSAFLFFWERKKNNTSSEAWPWLSGLKKNRQNWKSQSWTNLFFFFRAMGFYRQLLFGQIFVGKSVVLGNLGVGFQAFLNLTTSEKFFLLLGLVVFQLGESFRCVGFVVPNHCVIFWVTSLFWCPEKKVAEKCLQGAKLVFFPLRPLSYWKEETSTAPFGRSTPTAGLGETGFRSLLDAWPWRALDTWFTG